ncbi:MAG: putative structural protein [Prokaryotic dsDNA virus sp.]|nr:MAG: putative structural protein [Prokaryotic dsDNA virus sp.]|tara:strand:+ start:21593 stop:22516 length:924 start_codon:yes stop_codon:yes gene_type:complete
MTYITDYQYYENGGNVPEDANWGSYQYISLDDIVNNFMLMFQGNNELINNINRYQVLFFAKRAIQELNYDAMKEIKILQLQVDDQLRFILPQDYVNWVRISCYKDGCLKPLTENIQTNWSGAYLQDNDYKILFDIHGNVLKPNKSKLDIDRIDGVKKSIYLNQNSPYNGQMGFNIDGEWYFDYNIGSRFGLNTETANSNPTFSIDKRGGAINFSSGLAGESIVLEYVSDGMENGDDSSVSVNKLFEEFIYAAIKFSFLNNRISAPEYLVNRARKDRSSLLRNAKLRISNMHPGRLLMNLRGQAKWIK